jgi:hypothetical protein
MPTELSVNSICQIVSEEKLGFKFGKPDRPSVDSLACILPILRETSQKRQYVTFAETHEVLVTDSGSINRVNLKNTSKNNVFLRSGTIFEGKGTQSRALTRSAVIYPRQEVALDVRCVHASHGIRSGSGFGYGGITPLSVDEAFYKSGYTPSDQSTMWSSVTTASGTMASLYSQNVAHNAQSQHASHSQSGLRTRMPARSLRGMRSFVDDDVIEQTQFLGNSGQDNLKQNFDEFAKNFDAILSKARLHDNQVGLGLITEKGCRTVELFDLDASWEAIHKDSVKRMGTELLRGPDKTNVFEYKPENAVNAVRAVLGLPFKINTIYEHKPSNGEPGVGIFGLTAQRYVGEVVELDGRVIHLVLLESVAG